MHNILIILASAFTSVLASPQSTASTTGIALGATCDPSISNVCAGGASCYATNSMLIPLCGNFQASCTSNAQCAFNTCNAGFCNGAKPSSTSSSSTSKPTGTNLPLGAQCDPSLTNACASGVFCYATNSMLIPLCGNFQATCGSDAQCAFNTCNNGFCNGLKSSSTTPSNPSTTPSNPKPTGINLPLGAPCDPALTNVCADGVDCYATNFMLIPRCGNFQAGCKSDAQCAFNRCNNGFCNGALISSSSSSSSIITASNPNTYITTTTAKPSSSTTHSAFTIQPTGGNPSPTSNTTRTASPTPSPTSINSNSGAEKSVGGGIAVPFVLLIAAGMFL